VLDDEGYASEIRLVRETLQSLGGAHWRQFLDTWPAQ
jgi:hypothetical protein